MTTQLVSSLVEPIKPLARAVKYQTAYYLAKLRGTFGPRSGVADGSAFIIGCGRSGTTILGRLAAIHPDVTYLFEPYHLWAAVDPRLDALSLYTSAVGRYILRSEDLSAAASDRFMRIIVSRIPTGTRLVEKTPLNACRIGYLEALVADAVYIHIIRDGRDVAASIARLASTNSYRMLGKHNMNQWWGCNDHKWLSLVRGGKAERYYEDEVDDIGSDNFLRGIYEWLVTMREVEKHRRHLGDRLLELQFNEFVRDPGKALARLCNLLGIEVLPPWIDASVRLVRPQVQCTMDAVIIELPVRMAEDFNRYQEYYGLDARARAVPRVTR